MLVLILDSINFVRFLTPRTGVSYLNPTYLQVNSSTPQENTPRDCKTFKETKCALRNLLCIVLHSKSTAKKTKPVKSWQKIEQISSARHYLAQVPFHSLLNELWSVAVEQALDVFKIHQTRFEMRNPKLATET